MPELPEAENVRTRLEKYGAGRTITHVRVTEDSIVFSGVTADEFAEKMKNQKIKTAHRWGKYFWLEFETNGNLWPIFHLGMSGSVRFLESNGEDIHGAASDSENDPDAENGNVDDDEASALEADDEDFDRLKETAEKEQEEAVNPPPLKRRKSSTVSPRPDWPPRWWKFVLILDDGTQISFADCRRLGRVFLHQGPNPKDHTAIKKLGFDALLSVPDQSDFDALVARRSLPLKALLLNQAFAAGVGNWIADEVLYQARLHPERRANTLSKEELKTLRDKIINIVKTAVELKRQSKRLPEDWLFHRRWSKVAAKKETQKTVEGHEIAFATVGGRTSAYVPALQPAPEGFVNDDGEKKKKKTKKEKSGDGKKQKKSKKKAESDDEEEISMDDDEDSDDAPAPVMERGSSSRLSRQSSKKSLKEESSDEGEGNASAGESSDDDFMSTKSNKSRKRKSEDDQEEEKNPKKSPARKRSKLADVKEEDAGETKQDREESRPAPAKRKRSQIETTEAAEKPKLNRRKSSTTKPKKEPGEGH
eukprot:TRINITY_DN15056_c0_g1_i1.p1 TRINITY_DN15056_c0_g1~~TRINITY_DN15056_c0_g1_i1.p1  ORF type:complete len:534 (-),score=131.84 TRINITY_DN15056_c0_g1_i1:4-1605(-)